MRILCGACDQATINSLRKEAVPVEENGAHPGETETPAGNLDEAGFGAALGRELRVSQR
jgi:hypothetical protein